MPNERYGPDWLHQEIATGKSVIIDGPMGTELEARGVPMNETAWSGAALLSHPDVVRAIHVEYIAAGAEVIITNTFAAGRQALDSAGLGDEFTRINKRAVEAAKSARDESENPHVAIAGSMCPWVDSGASRSPRRLADGDHQIGVTAGLVGRIGAVAADEAELGALEKGERNALEDLVLTIGLPQVLELIDDLVGHIGERE